jgi:hypothetical protein
MEESAIYANAKVAALQSYIDICNAADQEYANTLNQVTVELEAIDAEEQEALDKIALDEARNRFKTS